MRTKIACLVAIVALVGPIASPASAIVKTVYGRFVDDDGSPHEPYIEAVAQRGITGGCTDAAHYCPNNGVTRAQMASFLARALELPPATSDRFTDDTGSPHEDNINRVAEAGIASGVAPSRFDPNGFVTRAQMASFIARGFQLPAPSRDYFADDAGSAHEDNINRVAEAQITTGCSADGTAYCPSKPVTRGQMATFLGRALGLDPVTPNPNTYFTDGTYQVGSEVPAQTYRMRQPPPPDEYGTAYCYWARLSGFGGSSDEINGNDFTDVPGIVTIDANEDKGFKSDGCGTWTSDLSPITSSPTAPFTGGTYFVGDDGDIAPGLWRNDGNHDGCYWARLSAFSGSSADILGNDYTDSQATVQIESTDVGFQAASDCGTWTKIG